MTIERVARAIAAEMEGKSSDSLWVNYEGAAQAAIKAMREPTDAQLEAGNRKENDYFPDNIWRAMIDAALGETS
jgi:hypothetical protein